MPITKPANDPNNAPANHGKSHRGFSAARTAATNDVRTTETNTKTAWNLLSLQRTFTPVMVSETTLYAARPAETDFVGSWSAFVESAGDWKGFSDKMGSPMQFPWRPRPQSYEHAQG